MADNDIYNSKARYEQFKKDLEDFTKPSKKANSKYYCKNPKNLQYFENLFSRLEVNDLSYVRRLSLIKVLKIVVFCAIKDLVEITRKDIDEIVIFTNNIYNPNMVAKFKQDLKQIWRIILPEKDEQGREDETIIPYVVRHLKITVDKSKQKAREDKLDYEEFEKLVAYFSQKPHIQAYIMLAFESLARPQELLWRKIKDVDLHDNYAKIRITSHGKEGIGILQCIDSFSFLCDWLNKHPFKKDSEAFLFVNEVGNQLTPNVLNKHIKQACQAFLFNSRISMLIELNGPGRIRTPDLQLRRLLLYPG